ncbi:hypothetical protein RHGRI_022245 [Rhododendron griersonianum]|uniref:Uncharacterized protein n=1 Tax=Rhododendron griersonianum TaxID=479676 RepID=A0AAV6IZ39_9ERIC|nr:hypothetical protein RHGRI_022245 [Rhododendron griersonianum]
MRDVGWLTEMSVVERDCRGNKEPPSIRNWKETLQKRCHLFFPQKIISIYESAIL